jgi:hypothetical protein
VDLIYVCVDDVRLDFCCVVYDQDIVYISCVQCYVLCVKKMMSACRSKHVEVKE